MTKFLVFESTSPKGETRTTRWLLDSPLCPRQDYFDACRRRGWVFSNARIVDSDDEINDMLRRINEKLEGSDD